MSISICTIYAGLSPIYKAVSVPHTSSYHRFALYLQSLILLRSVITFLNSNSNGES